MFKTALVSGLFLLLSGCNAVVLHPSGDVAAQQRNLIIIATILMLVIIVPVMALTMLFAYRYRHQNEAVSYEPDWDHSTQLELVIWAAPLLIIICLGALTWTSTHRLDPYHPIERIAAGKPVAANVRPLDIQVVALDWKWLFIYPEYGVATVNQVAAPVDRPVRFHITASTVMNSFYIPALAGQIYAMPSMVTELNAVINKPGDYKGISANFSGDGFSRMHFRFYGLNDRQFGQWVSQVRASAGALDRATYLKLEKPSESVPVIRYGAVAPRLFDAVVNHCVAPGARCMRDMMRADAVTASGHRNTPKKMQMAALDQQPTTPAGIIASEPLRGAGLTPPGRPLHREMTADATAPTARGSDKL